MENIDAVLTLKTLKEIGFVPSILIVGGWAYTLILALIFLYNLILYTIGLLFFPKKNHGK